MSIIHISDDDVDLAIAELRGVERRYGSTKATELAAAQIRASAAYLAKWTGPSVAAELLTREAHRLITGAAGDIAVPVAGNTASLSLPRQLARAAAWGLGLVGGFLLGLGMSAWA